MRATFEAVQACLVEIITSLVDFAEITENVSGFRIWVCYR